MHGVSAGEDSEDPSGITSAVPSSMRDILQANRGSLTALDFQVETVASGLMESGVFSQRDLEAIMTPRARGERVRVHYLKLEARINPGNFKQFLAVLEQAGRSDISAKLRPLMGTLNEGSRDFAMAMLSEKIYDEDIGKIAGELRKHKIKRNSLGARLGLCEDELNAIKGKSNSPQRRMFLLLRKWNSSSSENQPATFGALYQALADEAEKKVADLIVEHLCKKKCNEVKQGIR
ncbi:unnamed protein product [Darwinula stevensoni]|uniref:Death domain-containing protein n=1 Tax=Darwinula stevensoni TaxID=69355 RepID=A0A7R9A9F9_9CRUS|nr:unnamed protein product [Darwinula stevensoni]CAG0897359.1 unnamed protein product [Darwinula stevensoni]